MLVLSKTSGCSTTSSSLTTFSSFSSYFRNMAYLKTQNFSCLLYRLHFKTLRSSWPSSPEVSAWFSLILHLASSYPASSPQPSKYPFPTCCISALHRYSQCWELGFLPTSCTWGQLLDIQCRCISCNVKSLATLEAYWALESVGWSSGQTLSGLSPCLPFQSIIKMVVGIALSKVPWEKTFIIKKLLL